VPIEGAGLFELGFYEYDGRKLWLNDQPSMRKAVLSISGNVYKQQEMEIDKLIYDA
jgi:hypothetical protein